MVRHLRKAALALVVAAFLWLVGPDGLPPLERFSKGTVLALAWLSERWRENPTLFTWATLGILAVLYGGKLLAMLPRHYDKDPQRGFTSQQRSECFRRAGNRCEMETIWFGRCLGTAEHADHWLPHSRGGATNLANAVAACARHNLAKSDTVPSAWETARLERRRRHYFPESLDRSAGVLYQVGR